MVVILDDNNLRTKSTGLAADAAVIQNDQSSVSLSTIAVSLPKRCNTIYVDIDLNWKLRAQAVYNGSREQSVVVGSLWQLCSRNATMA